MAHAEEPQADRGMFQCLALPKPAASARTIFRINKIKINVYDIQSRRTYGMCGLAPAGPLD